jgi:DNA polymerase beta
MTEKRVPYDFVRFLPDFPGDSLSKLCGTFDHLDLRTKITRGAGGGLLHAININQKITDQLLLLIEETKGLKAATSDPKEKTKHQYRLKSFYEAVKVISTCDFPITSGSEAKKLHGIGKGIADRIDEILRSGKLSELVTSPSTPRGTAMLKLMEITGVGEARARIFVDEYGIRSIEDLRDAVEEGILGVRPNQLTKHIMVGLEFYEDLKLRIPWGEVHLVAEYLDGILYSLDKEIIWQICGSYRRARPTCGDIDIIITHPALKTENDVKRSTLLGDVVDLLTESGFLLGHLTERGATKYMGVCKSLSSAGEDDVAGASAGGAAGGGGVAGGGGSHVLGRRIDIRLVSQESFPTAVLYFTGSDQFNKLMRFVANERGFTLNEYGLYRFINGVKAETAVRLASERDVFKALNLEFIDPQSRDF